MMETFNIYTLLVPLIVIVDFLAIIQILRGSYFSSLEKGLIILMILLIPILGVSISYLLLFRRMKKGR